MECIPGHRRRGLRPGPAAQRAPAVQRRQPVRPRLPWDHQPGGQWPGHVPAGARPHLAGLAQRGPVGHRGRPTLSKTAVPALLALALAAALPAQAAKPEGSPARALHDRMLVLDTHLDTPLNLGRPGWSIVDDHRDEGPFSQVDYPRMVEGGLDGGFWVIYTGQGDRSPASNRATRDEALGRLVQIREMVAAHPDRFELALTADDARRIKAAGKKVVFLSMENASPLALDPSLLSFFHAQGLRMLGITHIGNNEFGDSSNPREGEGAEWGGLSPAGKALVAEANRLGIVLDQSHSADAVFDDLIELSKVPFVLSHSSA